MKRDDPNWFPVMYQEQDLLELEHNKMFGETPEDMTSDEFRALVGDERDDEFIYLMLDKVTHPMVKDGLVMGLAATKLPIRSDVLSRSFDETDHEDFRWRVMDTLILVDAPGIGPWLEARLADQRVQPKVRAYGLEAGARHCDHRVVARLAWELFPEWPLHAADALALAGSWEDLPKLEATVAEYVESGKFRGEMRPKFMRTPSRLRRRLEREEAKSKKAAASRKPGKETHWKADEP